VRHVRVEDARHELPPVNHFGVRKTRRSPHIYSARLYRKISGISFWRGCERLVRCGTLRLPARG
jgi:hypothetical protein